METMQDFAKELEESYRQFDEQFFAEDDSEEDDVWSGILEKFRSKETISVKVKEAVKGGAVAYVDEQRAFIPVSQLSDNYVENTEDYVGKHLDVRITEVDKASKKIILSAKVLLREQKEAQKKEVLGRIKAGDVYEGTVESIVPYGAFIALGEGISGLLHISQISDRRLGSPREVLKEGQKVKVRVLKTEEGKVSLTMRELEKEEPAADLSEGATFTDTSGEGAVTSLGDLLKGLKLD